MLVTPARGQLVIGIVLEPAAGEWNAAAGADVLPLARAVEGIVVNRHDRVALLLVQPSGHVAACVVAVFKPGGMIAFLDVRELATLVVAVVDGVVTRNVQGAA